MQTRHTEPPLALNNGTACKPYHNIYWGHSSTVCAESALLGRRSLGGDHRRVWRADPGSAKLIRTQAPARRRSGKKCARVRVSALPNKGRPAGARASCLETSDSHEIIPGSTCKRCARSSRLPVRVAQTRQYDARSSCLRYPGCGTDERCKQINGWNPKSVHPSGVHCGHEQAQRREACVCEDQHDVLRLDVVLAAGSTLAAPRRQRAASHVLWSLCCDA